MNLTIRNIPGFMIFTIFLFLLLLSPLFSSGDDISNVCASRCSGFTGQAYSRCIETCVRTSKKHHTGNKRKVSRRMQECEEICSVYQKVERIKCLRLCMDRNKD